MAEMASCPHCGDDDGYYENRTLVFKYATGWDGEEDPGCTGPEFLRMVSTTKPRCLSCNRIVEI